ncbi:MAG: D-alanyl-D-alanine carboxypeptidase family protein [Emergencia sp.]
MKEFDADLHKKNLLRKAAAALLSCLLIFSAGAGAFAADTPEETMETGQPVSQTEASQNSTQTTLTKPVISARSAVVVDGDTGKILYSKNSHYKRDPLSTTKLLTCLVALEHLNPDQKVTVTKWAAATGGSTAGLKAGEEVRVKDLIYAALLPSGNDAAVALAHAVSGTKAKFAVLMNAKAKELGCVDSHFSNPHGWKAADHYSSAYDMAIIAQAAMANLLIEKACSTEMYKMPKTNKHKARWISTTNSFVAKKVYPKSGVYAGKTGTWDYSNAALVSVCERNGRKVYAVVLKDTMKNRYKSTSQILNYSYKKLKFQQAV